MSFNQSTSDKNETQYRKTGRSASSNQQHRGYSPAYPKGTGATVSVTNVSPQVSGMAPAQRGGVQNGAHAQPQLHGGSDVPIASAAPQTAEASAPQRSFRIVPKPPTTQSVSVTSDTRKPTTPAKPPVDASKGVAIQLGSISPGFMNGMQPQMGPQIPQMGNLGISMASQWPQQQGRKFGGPRKTPVKITHPDTQEGLRLDKRTDSYSDSGPSAPRTHPNIPPQSQPIPSFAHPHTATYYANSYNPSSLYYPAPSSHPLTSSHMPPNSQAPRFSYPGSQASQPIPLINPSSDSTLPVSKSGSLVHNAVDPANLEHARNMHNISASVPSATVPVVIKPPAGTVGEKVVDPLPNSSDTGEQVRGVDDSDKDGRELGAKKYSRDFLLKFSVQFTELPEGFEIMSDIAQILNANVNAAPSIDYDWLPSPGRIVDRQGGATRLDRRGSGIMDDDRWNKGGAANFRTGRGPNFGVLRNPRAPTPVQQHVRGILPGPAHSVDHQGGMQRNNYDADRWQRATNFQPKGLMPSPHTPLPVMHKADRKYEVGKVSDEEQAKQRQLKAILNKLTPQNFEKLFEQVKAVNIDNATTLTGVVSQIFDKALMEPTFCEMYANFCFYLAGELPDFSEDNDQITFKRLLYNKCQEEFERGGREQEETNKAYEEGQVKQSEEEREEKRIKAQRQRLGTISLIGELYKKRMLTERIMHECIKKLFGQQQTPDEHDIEVLCKLMSTIGEMIDHPKAKEYMDAYFERMKSLSNNMKLSSTVRFMLNDAIDLRKNKWQQRRKVEGRIKIEEVHRDAAQERQAESSRLARGPGINPSARRGPPMEFSPRGSTMLSSPNAHMKLTPQNYEKLFEQRHQADRKNEVGKVSDEEQAKQRQLKAILNKLTPQNFEKLFEQVQAVNIDNATTLTGVISQIFDKALMEPTLCEMYANLCFYLAGELPDFSEDNEKITFKRLLLNKCQEEFERGEREQEEANKADEEGQVKQSEEEREEKRIKGRRRKLGNIRLIGELYKKKMLTERIMHECIKKMLGQQQTPDEDDIEALCKLMSTIGEMIDHTKAKEHMDAYFERMKSLSNNMKLSSRVRFMLNDAIDLRKNKWQQRSKVEGPKKIEEVHRDAAQELLAQSSRLARGPGINPSARRGAPMEFSPRGSTMLPSPNVRSFDRTLPTSPPTRAHGAALTQNVPSEYVLTEDRLRDMSLVAIKEFYSARDEKEVA